MIKCESSVFDLGFQDLILTSVLRGTFSKTQEFTIGPAVHVSRDSTALKLHPSK